MIASYPFTDFSLAQGVSGNGQVLAGATNQWGIPSVLTVEDGMMRAFLSDDHAITTVGHRTEMYLTPDSATGENWYAWEFMLPSSHWEGFTGAMTVGQMHDSPDGGDGARQPNFILQMYAGSICVVGPRGSLPTEGISFDRIPVAPLDLDRWYSICVRINWQTTSAGFREVLIDRVPVFRQWGVATAYADALGPYFKLGIYNTSGGDAGEKLAYFRNLTRWTGNDGYQTIIGGPPKCPPKLQLS